MKPGNLDPGNRESYIRGMTHQRDPGYLMLCDACCDNSGTAKEMMKTGGCTCDICGWACKCCGDDGKQFVNRIAVRNIPRTAGSISSGKTANPSCP